MTMHAAVHPVASHGRRAFTLIELLVVIAIIAVVAVLSAIAVGRLSDDARLAGATNQVLSALDEARAVAIRTNRSTAVIFVPNWDRENPGDRQVTECLIVSWNGDQWLDTGPNPDVLNDVFELVPDASRRRLPPGIKVAGPFYATGDDDEWLTQTELPLADPNSPLVATPGAAEYSGQVIGVLFARDGSLVSANIASFAAEAFFDRDGDGVRDLYADPPVTVGPDRYFNNEFEDESVISFVPFLSVFDDDAARELKTLDWRQRPPYRAELVGPGAYISQFGRRIEFNKYTGVPLR